MPGPAINRRSEVLAHSRVLLLTRGFNAFSHRDLAALVGVKSSSVHYYFPSKEDIGLALIGDYRSEVMAYLTALDDLPVLERLDRFSSLFVEAAAKGDQWCVAGMLASDFQTLGQALQAEVRRFFTDVEGWLATQVSLLRPDLEFSAAQHLGKTCMALLEGSLLMARSQGEPQRTVHAAESIKLLLGAT